MATVDQNPSLPTDVESLQALVVAMQQQLLEKDSALSAETAKRQAIEEHVLQLKQQLVEMRRARYGQSSEKLDENIHQLELMIEELESTSGESSDNEPATETETGGE